MDTDCRQIRRQKRGLQSEMADARSPNDQDSMLSPKRAKLSPFQRLFQPKMMGQHSISGSPGHSPANTTGFYGPSNKVVAYVNPWRRKIDFKQESSSSIKPKTKPSERAKKNTKLQVITHSVKKPKATNKKAIKKNSKMSENRAKIQVAQASCTTVEKGPEVGATEYENEKKKFFKHSQRLTVLNAVTLGKHKIQFRQGIQTATPRKVDTEKEVKERQEAAEDSLPAEIQEKQGNDLQNNNSIIDNEFLGGELTRLRLKRGTRSSKVQPGWHQSIIDAGQKDFGTKQCSTCGMVYTRNDEDDEHLHVQFHNRTLSAIKFNGWKNERTVREYVDGRVIMILPEDAKHIIGRLMAVIDVMNADLGFTDCSVLDRKYKAFLFVSDKKILGCVIAEEIDKGYRTLEENEKQALCCSTDSEPVFCGINRVWTCVAYRRKRIATRLLECICGHFYYGHILTPQQVAFSDPTPMGVRLARSFNSSNNFLVYKLTS